MLDIFNQDAFTVLRLADAMREIKYVPSYISSLGLFQTTSVDTLDIAIETDKDQIISIVPASPRGGTGDTTGRGRRVLRKLTIPHFERKDAIYADEVVGVRRFGDEVATEMLQTKIADRAAEHSQSFALTEEYHRLGVVTQGKLLDADGKVIFNYYDEFGEDTADEVNWDLSAANPAPGALRRKSTALTRAMGTALGGLPFTGVLALCGDNFFDDLTAHPEVIDSYKSTDLAYALRSALIPTNNSSVQSGVWGEINLFNIKWVNYRGNAAVNVPSDKVKFIPLGVPGLFRTVYGPADYMDTVGRPGQRLYAHQMEMRNKKGVELEFQMNAIHYCTRPRVLMSGKRKA